MNTLDHIVKKYNINPQGKLPVEIPNTGRKDLAKLFNELNFKIGAEIGVADGAYSKELVEANPRVKLYGIDAWEIYGDYNDYSVEQLTSYYRQVKKYFEPFPNYVVMRSFSAEALKKFDDGSLDFVYIDSNHQDPYIIQDITEWSKKVRPGGIVSGHDYYSGYKGEKGNVYFDVIKATHKYTEVNNIKPWFVLGLKEKTKGVVRDRSRSWFWIKP